MDCVHCGDTLAGPFCSTCGASAPAAVCPSCGQNWTGSDERCRSCDTLLVTAPATSGRAHAATGGRGLTGWWVSGALLVVVIVLLATPHLRANDANDPVGTALATPTALTGGPGSAANVDLSSMTPREAADRLFLRVMRAAAANDAVELQSFLPMALGAYDLVETLDSQGNFRVALLQRIAGMEQEALATVGRGLAADPTHLLLLGSAVELSVSLGADDDARQYATRLIDNYDEERDRARPEYEENVTVLENLRLRAEELVAPE